MLEGPEGGSNPHTDGRLDTALSEYPTVNRTSGEVCLPQASAL